MAIDLKSTHDIKNLLDVIPFKEMRHAAAVELATRSVLRVAPLLDLYGDPDITEAVALPLFRALAVSLVAGSSPIRTDEILKATRLLAADGFARTSNSILKSAHTFDALDADIVLSIAKAIQHVCVAIDRNDTAEALKAVSATLVIPDEDFTAAMRSMLSDDAKAIGDTGEIIKIRQPLWTKVTPRKIHGTWARLKDRLPREKDWDVWIEWYEAVSLGQTPWPEAAAVEIVTLPNDIWKQGSAVVNKRIKEILARHGNSRSTTEELINLASPQARLTADGKIDVGPNEEFDVPTADDDLPTLPIRQQRLIEVILSNIPAQSPRHLPKSLENYRDELVARGVRPIVGLLRDMADIIEAAVIAIDGEWLDAGMRRAFDRFAENNATLLSHFPLDIEREKRFAEIAVDEDAAVGEDFVKPFKDAEELLKSADVATKDALLVVERMREIADKVAYLPPSEVVPNPSHRWAEPKVSLKKRLILQAKGFYAGILKIAQRLGTTIDWIDRLRIIVELWNKFSSVSSQ